MTSRSLFLGLTLEVLVCVALVVLILVLLLAASVSYWQRKRKFLKKQRRVTSASHENVTYAAVNANDDAADRNDANAQAQAARTNHVKRN